MSKNANVERIQKHLNIMGHLAGPEDGWYGKRTQAGAESFIEHQGRPLPVLKSTSSRPLGFWNWIPSGACTKTVITLAYAHGYVQTVKRLATLPNFLGAATG